jgi:hypothetical protein
MDQPQPPLIEKLFGIAEFIDNGVLHYEAHKQRNGLAFHLQLLLQIQIRGCIQKFPDWVDKEVNNNNNKPSLRSNTKGYGGKTH